jgi:hypothetical protein
VSPFVGLDPLSTDAAGRSALQYGSAQADVFQLLSTVAYGGQHRRPSAASGSEGAGPEPPAAAPGTPPQTSPQGSAGAVAAAAGAGQLGGGEGPGGSSAGGGQGTSAAAAPLRCVAACRPLRAVPRERVYRSQHLNHLRQLF